MDDGYSPLSILLFLVFILLEAAFYGFGAAIQNINPANLEKEMEQGSRKAGRLLRFVNRPTRFVNSIQIVTNVIGMVIGAYILRQWSLMLEQALGKGYGMAGVFVHGISLAVSGSLILAVLIVFGIIIPKRCAAREPERWGYRLFPFISVVMTPLIPFIWMVSKAAYVVLRVIGIDMSMGGENMTEEDIMSMVNEGHEQGLLEASEAEMITNIFKLDDKNAGNIMTHRTNLVAIDAAAPLKEALAFILNEGKNSRYPVYKKDMDDIVGILHMKDAMIYAEKEGRSDTPVGEIPGLLREASFIPETRSLDSLFKEMQSTKNHMVIVVDEYGQTAGIVTMEDILEEIVGNILDEYDAEEEYIVAAGEGFLLNGLAHLEEVACTLDIRFSEEDRDSYDTLNGFLISRVGHIPQKGENLEVTYQNYRFVIQSVENKMIRTVKALPVQKEKSCGGNEEGFRREKRNEGEQPRDT